MPQRYFSKVSNDTENESAIIKSNVYQLVISIIATLIVNSSHR